MRQSRSRTSEYLTQRRKAAKAGHLSFRPKGEILLRSLAVTRDDGLARSISVLGERNIRIQKFALYAHILSESYFIEPLSPRTPRSAVNIYGLRAEIRL